MDNPTLPHNPTLAQALLVLSSLFESNKIEIIDQFKQAIREEMAAATNNDSITPVAGNKKLITQKELCAHLGITEQTIIKVRKRKKLRSYLIGTSVRYNLEEVLSKLEKNG
jgi:hypothetical protein